jgi:hypothetical protein
VPAMVDRPARPGSRVPRRERAPSRQRKAPEVSSPDRCEPRRTWSPGLGTRFRSTPARHTLRQIVNVKGD